MSELHDPATGEPLEKPSWAELGAMNQELQRLREALEFYANPENYHAILFMFDRPCGAFADDFELEHGHPGYKRAMPGKLARSVLREYMRKKEEK